MTYLLKFQTLYDTHILTSFVKLLVYFNNFIKLLTCLVILQNYWFFINFAKLLVLQIYFNISLILYDTRQCHWSTSQFLFLLDGYYDDHFDVEWSILKSYLGFIPEDITINTGSWRSYVNILSGNHKLSISGKCYIFSDIVQFYSILFTSVVSKL